MLWRNEMPFGFCMTRRVSLFAARTAADRELYQRQIETMDARTARPCTLGVNALVASRVAVEG